MGRILLLLLLAAPQEAPTGLRAGAAASNITPPLGLPIVGNWTSPPAAHVHDELHARCLVLEDGGTRLAIVVCDNVGIGRAVLDEARRLVHAETGLPPANLLVSSTHTHSAVGARGDGPPDAYGAFVARRIADGVRRAVANLAPAKIAWGAAAAPEHVFNRRYVLREGVRIPDPFGGEDKVLMNPGVGNPDVLRPAGPVDPELAFLSVRTRDGRPLALLANYSLHYVGGVPGEHVSADYFAVFADDVQRLLGADRQDPPFVGMMSNGTSGDVNNVNVLGPREKRAPYEKMRLVARSLAEKVVEAEKALAFREAVPLGARMEELRLGARRPSPELVERSKAVLARPKDAKPAHAREVAYAERALRLAEGPEEVSVPIQALRIGDLGIAAIPFEVFTDIGLEIKRRTPFERSFTISLANGSFGYLPTPEHHALGGYETWLGTNKVEVQASVKITAKALALLQALR
jgi:neutral ceramidase